MKDEHDGYRLEEFEWSFSFIIPLFLLLFLIVSLCCRQLFCWIYLACAVPGG